MTRDEVVELVHAILLEEMPQYLNLHDPSGAGMTAESRRQALLAEGEEIDQTEDPVLTADDVAGIALATGFTGGRSMVTEPTASGFDAFDVTGQSGTIDRSEAARKLGQLIQEGQRRKQLVDETGEPVDPRFLVRW